MTTPTAGISEADWVATPASVREIVGQVQALRDENEQLRAQLTAVATELAELRERIGRRSRNASKPPSSDGPGFKLPQRRKGSGRKRGSRAIPDRGRSCCRLSGWMRWWNTTQMPAAAAVVRCWRERIRIPCASTCATLPAGVEASH